MLNQSETKLAAVDLSDVEFDGRVIIGKCTKAAKTAGASKSEVDAFIQKAFLCDTTELLALVTEKFDVSMDEGDQSPSFV